ncbi:MAG: hypothetical protein JXA62_06225 [Candidatus Aminicenantes bacterium]|nr:hypothetical protein [Candidatus Aminicenantes bacterium]
MAWKDIFRRKEQIVPESGPESSEPVAGGDVMDRDAMADWPEPRVLEVIASSTDEQGLRWWSTQDSRPAVLDGARARLSALGVDPLDHMVAEIAAAKALFARLQAEGLIAAWHLPYESLLTRLTAAIFFYEPVDEARLEEIHARLASIPRFWFRLNEEQKLSTLKWRVEFNKDFEL